MTQNRTPMWLYKSKCLVINPHSFCVLALSGRPSRAEVQLLKTRCVRCVTAAAAPLAARGDLLIKHVRLLSAGGRGSTTQEDQGHY